MGGVGTDPATHLYSQRNNMTSLKSAADSVRLAVTQAFRGLVQRETLVQLVVLCAVAREHFLVIGPPGTAKSEAVRRIARRLGGNYFEYLIGRFTEPTEVFLGSTAILNTLLSILNERAFRRGHTRLQCPLRVCVGASNALPEDGQL